MECWGENLVRVHARNAPYPLYYLSSAQIQSLMWSHQQLRKDRMNIHSTRKLENRDIVYFQLAPK